MLSVGKLFAVAAIIALIAGFISWPQPETGFYTITLKNRAYGFGAEYWAFSISAIFAVLAAAYYWFPIVFTHALNSRMSNLHFWLSAFSAVGFLVLAPGITFIARRGALVSEDYAVITTLAVAFLSLLFFLVGQAIFVINCLWSAFYSA